MAKIIHSECGEFTIAIDEDADDIGIETASTVIYLNGEKCGEIVSQFDEWTNELTHHLFPATLPQFIVGLYVGDYNSDDAAAGYTFDEPGHEFAN